MSRARCWCFTAWEPKEWSKLVDERISYVIVGEEVCPETKKVHYQGYLECSKALTFATMKKILGETAHIESRKGSQAQAIDYCKKDGKWEEYGELKTQGKRTDLDKCIEMIDDGLSNNEILRSGVSWQAQKGIKALRQLLIVPHGRTEKAKHTVLKCTEDDIDEVLAGIEGEYDSMSYERGFWTGYTGQDTVVIVHERDAACRAPVRPLLRVGIKNINTKGGESVFAPKHVIEIDVY